MPPQLGRDAGIISLLTYQHLMFMVSGDSHMVFYVDF
jgi:hypothetical protein